MRNNGNLNREYSTEEDLGVGSQPASSLHHFVQQIPRHLFSRLGEISHRLWMSILTHQSPAQADMLLNAKRLNLRLDKETEVLQVGHLRF